jgi:hypothetical protein
VIRVHRGEEPAELARVRAEKLPALEKLARERLALGNTITGDDVDGYRCVSEHLWKKQHHKCCYCENKIREVHNDVEHHRPKGGANRKPGCTDTHGYWWLAFTWENLLFACRCCNRSEKNDRFPLAPGDTALRPSEQPPGDEHPHLLDPADAATNPVEHIQFEYRYTVAGEHGHVPGPKQWLARPRDGSPRGAWTIEVCGLNDASVVELRTDHFKDHIQDKVSDLEQAVGGQDRTLVERAFARASAMFAPEREFAALAYDAFRHFIPDAALAPWKLAWPAPQEVALPPRMLPVRRRPAAGAAPRTTPPKAPPPAPSRRRR